MLFKQKEDKFFALFVESACILRQGTYLLQTALQDPGRMEEYMAAITDIEHTADELNDAIVDRLNSTFITPLDREDIYAVANMLDDITDFLQGTVERMLLYRTGQPSAGTLELARLLTVASEELVKAFELLKNIKGNHHAILEHSRKIVDLESEGDKIYRKEVAHLFATCKDPVEIIKWKEVLETLEATLDHCERVADLLRGVVMKYA